MPNVLRELAGAPRYCPLGPGAPSVAMRPALERLTPEMIAGERAVKDREMAQAALAGLWLYYDFLDESHTISQGLSDRAGAYWHGMMHRREPDPGNAKYWFRRVGRHAIFPQLAREAAAVAERHKSEGRSWHKSAGFLLGGGEWDPFAWIDLCEAARRDASRGETLCVEVQQKEWELLFQYSCDQAFGG